jgi:hypothetical protein
VPEFHQPGPEDRAQVEHELEDELDDEDVAVLRARAASLGVADVDRLDRRALLAALRAAAPSQRADPAWPDAPTT